jgi:hypothetical protein
VPTRFAFAAQEAVGEDTTLDVVAKLVLDVAREWALVVLSRVSEKRFEVLLNDAVQDRVFGPPGSIRGRLRLQTADAGAEHDESR